MPMNFIFVSKGIKNLNNSRIYAIVDKQTSLSQDLELNQSHEEEQ